MDELTKTNSLSKPVHKPFKQRMLTVLVCFVIVFTIIYCCGLPYITGQSCFDIASGHVPFKAEEIFLRKLFEATVKEDDQWLDQVTTDNALEDLKAQRSVINTQFEIIWGDDLGGTYERTIQFENGTKVYLEFLSL